jgi:hypothetical protein
MSGKEVLDAYVFVERGPVKPVSPTDDAPVISLFPRPVEEARIPCERSRYRASVGQLDRERVVGDGFLYFTHFV